MLGGRARCHIEHVFVSEEEIWALAVELEAEEITDANDEPLSSDDIYPVLEILWERGVDLAPAKRSEIELSEDDDQAIDSTVG